MSLLDASQDLDSMNGIIDLSVTGVRLNPDNQVLDVSMSGTPYGAITYRGNSDLFSLGLPTATPNAELAKDTTAVPSCKIQRLTGWGCATLNINFGSKQLIFATGDGFGRRTETVDVSADAPLDNYPFDSYTATGTVKVWHRSYSYSALAQALTQMCRPIILPGADHNYNCNCRWPINDRGCLLTSVPC